MSTRAHPDLEVQPRYVLFGPLAEGRRVLDIGGDAASAKLLAEAGAAELVVGNDQAETIAAQLAEAEIAGIEVLPTPQPPFPYADDSFDLIICHDLGELIVENDDWLAELRRVLTTDGSIALSVTNPNGSRLSDLTGQTYASALSYEEAFSHLSERFGRLTVFVQSPLVGNLFYDLESEEEEPVLIFDRSLLTDDLDEAGWYVLLFGPEAKHTDDFTIVPAQFDALARAIAAPRAEAALRAVAEMETPADEALAEEAAGPPEAPAEPEVDEKLEAVERHGTELERQLTLARHRTAQLDNDRQLQKERLQRARARLLQAEGGREAEQQQIAELQQRVAEQEATLETVDGERTAAIENSGRLGEQLLALRTTLDESQEELRAARQCLSEVEAAHANTSRALEESQARVAELEGELGHHGRELQSTREDLQRLRDSRDSGADELAELERQLETARQQAETAAGDSERARQELDALEGKLEATQQREDAAVGAGERAREELASLLRLREEAEDDLQRMRARISGLKSERDGERAKINDLRSQMLAQLRELEETRRELPLMRERRQNLIADRDREKEKVLKLRQRAQQLETELQSASDATNRAREERDTALANAQANHERVLSQLTAEVEERQQAALRELEADRDRALASTEAQLEEERQQAGAAKARLEELERELARNLQDKNSFEAQIKDLLEEVAELRARQDAGAAATDTTATELTREQAKSESLQQECDRLQTKVQDVEGENLVLAEEVQRLTDTLHELETTSEASARDESGSSSPPTDSEMDSTPQSAAKLNTMHDAVGRPLENSLEDIEDLIAGSVPPPPSRR